MQDCFKRWPYRVYSFCLHLLKQVLLYCGISKAVAWRAFYWPTTSKLFFPFVPNSLHRHLFIFFKSPLPELKDIPKSRRQKQYRSHLILKHIDRLSPHSLLPSLQHPAVSSGCGFKRSSWLSKQRGGSCSLLHFGYFHHFPSAASHTIWTLCWLNLIH